MRNPERFWDRIAKNYDKSSDKKRANLLKTIENIKPDGRLICETPCLGESAAVLGWLIAIAGKLGMLPKILCFTIADLKSMITSAPSLQLIESESVDKNQKHWFVVAKKI